jgi:hypothetical protein
LVEPRISRYGPHVRRELAPCLIVSLALGCAESGEEPRKEPALSAPAAASTPAVTSANVTPASVLTPAPAPAPSPEPAVVDDGAPRAYAKVRFAWIRPEPTTQSEWVGFLWTGGSVRLKSDKPIPGYGCQSFYAIEPRGYVCVDGERITLDKNDPVLRAIAPYRAKLDTPWPHEYGESIGLARFDELPTTEYQGMKETYLERHLANVEAVRRGETVEALLGVDASLPDAEAPAFPPLPRTIREGRYRLKPRSTVAYSTAIRHGERPFLLAADFSWVPKDRVKPYPKITFQGTKLDGQIKLPIAFFRGRDRDRFRRAPDGAPVPTGEKFARLSWVQLSGDSFEWEGERYLATSVSDIYVKESEAVVPTPRGRTPWGAEVGSPDTTGLAPKGRASWLEISIRGGWLLAYEGTQPVYATLMSPGRGGEPVPDKPTLETASTPTGTYPINGKFATATMEAPNEFIHSDVPWVMNFTGPYAIHGAYWHDEWGHLKSAGCVNVSPIDGKWLYEFTDPKMPEGWHGTRWVPKLGPTTLVVLRR